MKLKLAGLALGVGVAMAAQADTFNFTPITDPGNSLLQSLGSQLTMDVTDGGSGNVLFTFTNAGDINSTIARVYLDDAPVDLFSDIGIASQSAGVHFTRGTSPDNLPGGNNPAYGFSATSQFGAAPPPPHAGINDSGTSPGEALTLSATLNAGKSFADVISSLAAGGPTDGDFLRLGLHVISIAGLNDDSASFLDAGNGGGASPPPPIPEPETYGMLIAGLGIMAAMGRRRLGNR